MTLQDNFKAYCDGELSIAERSQVTKHLESNEADRKAVEDLRQLSKAIREYVTRPEPVGLEKTLAALEKAQPTIQKTRIAFHQLWWVGAVGVVVIGIGLVNVLGSGHSHADSADVSVASPARSMAFAKRSADGMPSQGAPLRSMAKSMVPVGGGEPSTAASAPAESPNGFGRHEDQSGSLPGVAPNTGEGKLNTTPQANGEIAQPPQVPPTQPLHQTHAPLVQKDASLTIKVDKLAEAQQTIETLTVGNRGWVQQSNRNEAEGQNGTANLTLRVPVQNFDKALKEIRSLGTVISDSSSGNDVTSGVVDMEARLKVLRTEEGDYLALLARARSTAAIMEIKDKLTEIRTQIEEISGQKNLVKDMAAYSTINVTLQQKQGPVQLNKQDDKDPWVNDTWATAVNGLSSVGRIVGQLLIFVLVWTPIWIPAALIGAWIYRKAKW